MNTDEQIKSFIRLEQHIKTIVPDNNTDIIDDDTREKLLHDEMIIETLDKCFPDKDDITIQDVLELTNNSILITIIGAYLSNTTEDDFFLDEDYDQHYYDDEKDCCDDEKDYCDDNDGIDYYEDNFKSFMKEIKKIKHPTPEEEYELFVKLNKIKSNIPHGQNPEDSEEYTSLRLI